ncbi:hypothetical protein CYMTET_14375 [Cymbomonas tetramitiformis]|uniref:Uncharacterized protein n=1 Tax=Cymbomonas tetramitiformis TaxID=36881 RepID=A0AAE0GGG5_9CHLO|nr:hypothetical protein CYMTET_14375 [Cymbomonas tetramitiformis]
MPKEAKAAGSSATTKGDKELARRQKLPYCPYSESNPYPPRPATLESQMRQLYDLYGNKTFDSLNKKSSSSLEYVQLVLGPALAYLYDAVQFSDDTLELVEHQDTQHVSAQEIEQRVSQRLRWFCGRADLNQWLQEFDSSRQRAMLNTTSKQAAKGAAGGRFSRRERRVAGQKEPTLQERVLRRKGAWRAAGVNAEVLQWASRGAKINWL